jgi:hypothetical protein
MKTYQLPKAKTIAPPIQTAPNIDPVTGSVTWNNGLSAEQVAALKQDLEVKSPSIVAWNSMKQCADAEMTVMQATRHLRGRTSCSEAQIRRFFAAYNRLRGIKKPFRYQRNKDTE